MKRLIIYIIVAACCTLSIKAQVYVGGSLGFTTSKLDLGGEDNNQSGSSFKILPEVGYQFNDRWTVGINLGYIKGYAALGSFDVSDIKALGNAIISTAADIASDDMANFDLKTFRIAPYVRYCVYKIDRLEFFLDGMVGFNSIKASVNIESTANLDDKKLSCLEICIKPGIAFSLSKHTKLTAKMGSLGYQNLKLSDSDMKISRFGFDIDGNSLMIGALYYF